jgi:hypothetical protein
VELPGWERWDCGGEGKGWLGAWSVVGFVGEKELLRVVDRLVAEELGVLDDRVVARNQAEGFQVRVEV